jgi:hypothetical protein
VDDGPLEHPRDSAIVYRKVESVAQGAQIKRMGTEKLPVAEGPEFIEGAALVRAWGRAA